MNVQGVIKDVRPSRGRLPGSIIFDDGEMFGCFDRELLALAKEHVGQKTDMTYEEKVSAKTGKTYRNVQLISFPEIQPSPQEESLIEKPREPREVVTAVAIHAPSDLERLEQGYLYAKRQHELILDLLRSRLVAGTHFMDGKTFGSSKPVLLQPGAHAILQTLGYAAIPVIVAGPMEAPTDKNARYTIVVRVDVFNASGRLVGAAFGSASSTIWSNRQLSFVGRAVDPDKIHNSTMKMAVKRSIVAACRQATPASELFVEDIEEGGYGVEAPAAKDRSRSS